MKITRKGYYTISGPDSALLTKPDGSLRQAISRDDCYEYITDDSRNGTFTIHCPDREVDVGLLLGQPLIDPIPDAVYIATAGDDGSGDGSIGSPWATVSKVNGLTLNPGTSVFFNRGDSWAEDLSNLDNGSAGNIISFGAYGSGSRPLLRSARIDGEHKTWQDIDINAQQQANTRALDFRNGGNIIVRRAEIQNGVENGLQIADVTSVHLEDLDIHDFYKGSSGSADDAHGISLENVQNLTAAGAIKSGGVSGDSIQVDPGRSESDSIDFSGAALEFWSAPITGSNFNAGWVVGNHGGENAIDTKVKAGTRMAFIVGEIVCYGWNSPLWVNAAAFNLKEGVDFVADRITVYNSEIAFRCRGGSDNPDITIKNAVVYDCTRGVRAETNLDNFQLYNSTFGSGITTFLEEVDGGFDTGLDVRNNVFLGTVPATFSDASNVEVTAGAFVDEATNDYRHLDTATTIDEQGATIAAVTQDRLGVARAAPYSIGAYEVGVSTASHAYFDLLAGNSATIRAVGLRTPTEVFDNRHGTPETTTTVYDATFDAARFETKSTKYSVENQIRIGMNISWDSDVTLSDSNMFMSWEAYMPDVWVDNSPATFKAFQLSDSGLTLEPRFRFSKVQDVNKVALLDTRVYGSRIPDVNFAQGDTGSVSLLAVNDVDIPSDTWLRFWSFFDHDNDAYTYWVSFSGQAPIRICDEALMVWDSLYGSGHTWSEFWYEFNTSSSDVPPSTQNIYARNFVVMKNLANLAAAQTLVDQGSLL